MSPDNPIEHHSEDLLGRSQVALSFSNHVLELDASRGVVIGVLGKWGSGKTSFLNLMRPTLTAARAPIIDFNPWLFSGVEELANAFFNELSAQLKPKKQLADVTRAIEEYGETLSDVARLPLIGSWYGAGLGAAKAINKIVQRRKGGVLSVRSRVTDALAALETPITVIIDDVDRLSTSEIRQLFKLVRLTANFPNIIYLVAFDRERVENALSEDGAPGRDYLEKILQMVIDLPFIPTVQLQQQIFQSIDGALKQVKVATAFDEKVWPNIFFEIVKPLIRNMRDVRRYTSSLKWVVESLDGKISLGDVLALEAVRIFLPDLFYQIPEISHVLTSTDQNARGHKEKVESFVASAGEKGELAESLIKRLFPAAQGHVGGSQYGGEWKNIWLKDKRVASNDLLSFYLERVAGESLTAFGHAERAWSVFSDEEALSQLFDQVNPSDRESLVQSLEAYESEYRREHVVPACVVLLNVLTTIPDRPRGFLEFDADMTVGRVVYRLVRSLEDSDLTMDTVQRILPRINLLTQKLQLITLVGDREGAGHKLVSEADARKLEGEWRMDLASAKPDELAMETDLVRVFYEELHQVGEGGPRTAIPADPRVTHAMVRSAKGETKSQSGDSSFIERRPRLAWDVLAKVYGGEDVLAGRIIELKESSESVEVELLELAEKYASGWRPNDRDGEG